MINKYKYILGAVFFLLLVLGVVYSALPARAGNYDSFASCLKEKGATLYGSFFCPHCSEQKALFGSSKRFLDYKECSIIGGKASMAFCKDKKIEGYPTWIFSNGEKSAGVIPLELLSIRTGCVLPK